MKITIERGRVVPFSALPPFSIALDGYCQGPALDPAQQRFSFDHHDGCIRLVTRATCQQVLDALLLGLNPQGLGLFLNDVDGDTVLSVWLLQNSGRIREPLVRALVESVGALDAHGPAYPVLNPELADAFFNRAMQPETQLRRSGAYGRANLSQLLQECLPGVDALLSGLLSEEPHTEESHQIVHRSALGWVMVESSGFVFRRLYEEGFTRVVLYSRMQDGSFAYTIARQSDLVAGFPVGPHSEPGSILHALNQREPGWGGGSSIGGAPRNLDGSRSVLRPEEVFSIIEGVLHAPLKKLAV
jgi:hypothetical protein